VEHNTGSHVDLDSLSLLAGLAWGQDFTPGRLTLGAFMEYGTGDYDTYNSFANAATVRGNGQARHIGGGFLGRFDADSGGYGEGSARIGRLKNEFKTDDLRDAMGHSARGFDISAAYYGLHLGGGYIWNLSEQASVDIYGKYFWTKVEGASVTLATDDPVEFQSINSHRVRVGSRFSYAVNEFVSPYIGAAYEHEFGGRQKAATYGYAIDAPSLRGGTGVGEIGLALKPSTTLPLSLDLGLTGYTGKREGLAGSLSIRWEF
jgi:outer membrane autotransporter protein